MRSESDAQLTQRLAAFVRFARARDYQIGVGETLDAIKMAQSDALHSREKMYWGLRSIFCQNKLQWIEFDHMFKEFWQKLDFEETAQEQVVETTTHTRSHGATGISGTTATDDEQERSKTVLHEDDGVVGQGGASSYEVLAHCDFRFVWNHEQMREIELWVDRLAARLQRRLRRRLKEKTQGNIIDFRRTARRSVHYGGWPIDVSYRQRRRRVPEFVLLLDVSQSMEVYSYLFLRFARAIAQSFKRADVFAFHTRLVHIGDVLKLRDNGKVQARVSELSSGWLGGTRISGSLAEYCRSHIKQLNSQSIVLIFSDGYDTAEPEDLSVEIKKIKSQAKRVIWVNPLLGRREGKKTEKIYPVEKSLQLALPHLDIYTSAHNLHSLQKLESALIQYC